MAANTGRKNPKIYRGVLENAGLGEVAFFLKKAKQEILYAVMALEHTDFSSFDEFNAIQAKIVKLRGLITEISDDMSRAEKRLMDEVVEREFSAGSEDD
jgi:hypothetical protein